MINSKGQERTKWNSFVDWYREDNIENFIFQTLIELGVISYTGQIIYSHVYIIQQLIDAGLITNISEVENYFDFIPT